MGVTPSKDNEDLIDTLVETGHIRSPCVEMGFRLVDRGRYIPIKYNSEAYTDQPFKIPEADAAEWRPGLLHISAPCMYACVLEKLQIRKGDAFLNIGSGSGWLNTLCGYLIGATGINHGIEIHENLIEYAEKILKKTMQSGEVAAFDWCKPKFMHGNGLTLKLPDGAQGYNRIYCGASVHDAATVYRLLRLLVIGGRLVAPFNNGLFAFTRTDEFKFKAEHITTCQFADLIIPPNGTPLQKLPSIIRPTALKSLCRKTIRSAVRSYVDELHSFVLRLETDNGTSYNEAMVDRRVILGEIREKDDVRSIHVVRRENSVIHFRQHPTGAGHPAIREFEAFMRRMGSDEGDAGGEEHFLPGEAPGQQEIYVAARAGEALPEDDGHESDDDIIDDFIDFAAEDMGLVRNPRVVPRQPEIGRIDEAENDNAVFEMEARRVIEHFAFGHQIQRIEAETRHEREERNYIFNENRLRNSIRSAFNSVRQQPARLPDNESLELPDLAETDYDSGDEPTDNSAMNPPPATVPRERTESEIIRDVQNLLSNNRDIFPRVSLSSLETGLREDEDDPEELYPNDLHRPRASRGIIRRLNDFSPGTVSSSSDEDAVVDRKRMRTEYFTGDREAEQQQQQQIERPPRCPSLLKYGHTYHALLQDLPVPKHLTRYICLEN